ncbi:hypothetical protein IWQ60_000619 [Tieghemiomyces parasiticus]|uniref:alanine--glyoxylate transaminase n=1 Tax=Tieghemiomyces parasiticus TaxID=78921 RepID=A0A9W8E398_9FUNG|nr:hypothetical protein IWQ60_000619 [Tieghemiomyces parasiticus]
MSTESHKLCMIPGPVEFHEDVLGAMSTPATSHVDPGFIQTFGEVLEGLRRVVATKDGQPFVVSGSGTLSWDLAVCNVIEAGDRVLVVNTGLFGDRMAECLEVFGAVVTTVRADRLGQAPNASAVGEVLAAAAREGRPYKMITITHVDTSTGVLADVQGIATVARNASPGTLVAVDGVCSIAAEELYMDDWGIDVIMTASQKALGTPPGLAIIVVSQRTLDAWRNRKSKVIGYFAAWSKWLPVMQAYEERRPLYFATPAVQLIMALRVGIQQLLDRGMDAVFQAHHQASAEFKAYITDSLGLTLLPVTDDVAAHSMTAIYYPEGVKATDLLPRLTEHGVVVAGGLHPDLATRYFRVGHMGLTVLEPQRRYLETTKDALGTSLAEAGYKPSA